MNQQVSSYDGGRAPRKLRRRFVSRAKFLKQHRPFLAALDQARISWDTDYPQYLLGRRAHVPDDPLPREDLLASNTLRYVLPGPLRLAAEQSVQDAIVGSWEAYHAGEQPVWRQNQGVLLAEAEWSQRIQQLCAGWFPPDDFPNWRGRFTHPAMYFVSACMIWEPIEVDENWIDDKGIEIQHVEYDPRDPAQSADARLWRQAWANLQVRLIPIPPESSIKWRGD